MLIYQAEVLVVMKCADREEVIRITIPSNSRAVIKDFGAGMVKSKVVRDCMEELNRLSEVKEISIEWVPGQGLVGNEKMDELAREGSATEFVGPEPVTNQRIKNWIEGKELDKEKRRECKESKILIGKVERKRSKFFLGLGRQEL